MMLMREVIMIFAFAGAVRVLNQLLPISLTWRFTKTLLST